MVKFGSFSRYSINWLYHWLTHSIQADLMVCNDITWNKLEPIKSSLFVWRLLSDRLTTKDILLWRDIYKCDLGLRTGDANHLFLSVIIMVPFDMIFILVRNFLYSSLQCFFPMLSNYWVLFVWLLGFPFLKPILLCRLRDWLV
jgi:hypothetical protein